MDNFSIVLPSNAPRKYAHNNTNKDFIVSLETPIELNGDYEVGLSQIFLPDRKLTIQYKVYTMTIFRDKATNLPLSKSADIKQCKLDYIDKNNPYTDNNILAKTENTNQTFSHHSEHYVDKLPGGMLENNHETEIAPVYVDQIINTLNPKEPWHTFPVNLIVPDYPETLEHMIKTQMRTPTDNTNQKLFNCLISFEHNAVTGNYELEFKYIMHKTQENFTNTTDAIHVVVLLPDFVDKNTLRLFRSIGYPDFEITRSGLKYTISDSKTLHPNNIDVELNIVDLQQVDNNTYKRLLKRVRRVGDTICDIQFKEIVYLPVNTNYLTHIHVTMSTEDHQEAHIYDKCQLVLNFRRREQKV